jgi:peptidoglycan lytic transglycosylase D
MQSFGNHRVTAGVLTIAGAVLLAGCAITNHPQQFRTFFLPPAHSMATADDAILEAPPLAADLYANEAPSVTASLPALPRPSDADFLLKKAEDRFTAGKHDYQEGSLDDARREFNQAVEILLTAPENLPDRPRLERRLEELVEEIYRYDLDQLGAGEIEDQVSYDKAPLDGILEMTFPVDPSLRSKVSAQIQATVSQLPLEESDAVVGAINFFSTGRGKKILAAGLQRAGRYKPLIERILADEGLPQELIFVAQAESGFLPRAVSNKQCAGMWQFAKFRGREYGLTQTPATDDRMDPEKATRAAAHHLHDLYAHFGDWYLALAAYNCGPACVDHAIMRTGYADFWSLRRLNVLPKETANYVPVILAMTIISKNAKDYELDNLELQAPVEFDTLELQTATSLALIADAVERPASELRDLNPGLLKAVAPAGYAFRLPKGTLPAVETAFSVIPANRRDSWRLHRVENGDSFAGLAKRFGTTVATISSANHEDLPEAGELLAIPVAYAGDRAAAHAPHVTHAAPASARRHAPPVAASVRAPGKGKTAHKKVSTVAHRSPANAPLRRAGASGTPAS